MNPLTTYRAGRCPHCHTDLLPSVIHKMGRRTYQENRCEPCHLTWTYDPWEKLLTVWADKRHGHHMTWDFLQEVGPEWTIADAVRRTRAARMRSLMIKG